MLRTGERVERKLYIGNWNRTCKLKFTGTDALPPFKPRCMSLILIKKGEMKNFVKESKA